MVTILRESGVDFWSVGALPLGVGLELLAGGLARKPTPGDGIDRLAEVAERGLRSAVANRGGGHKAELAAGVILAVVVVGLVGGLASLATAWLGQLAGPARLVGQAALIAAGLSFGRLGREVARASDAPDLATARRVAAAFAGLGSARLDQSAIRRAGVEAIGGRVIRLAIAPMFWLAIAGVGGLWAYQAIATLHDRFARLGPRSRYFGFVADRLDDLANFAPARLAWLLIALSAALLGEDGLGAFRSGLAQGRRQPHRPEAWGIATLDAALGLDPGGPVDRALVRRALRTIHLAGLHAVALAIACRVVAQGV